MDTCRGLLLQELIAAIPYIKRLHIFSTSPVDALRRVANSSLHLAAYTDGC